MCYQKSKILLTQNSSELLPLGVRMWELGWGGAHRQMQPYGQCSPS